MSYTEKLEKIGNNALKFIKKELDQKGQIIIFDIDDVEDEDYYNYPNIGYVGKHGNYYSYYIYNLFKKDENYHASGVNNEDDTIDVFDLPELTTEELAQLADYIKSDEQYD